MELELERPAQQHGPATLAPSRAVPGELKFAAADGFHRALRQRVEWYFTSSGRSPRDCPQMYLKTALILLTLTASYGLLLFGVSSWWQALPLAISLGLAMAAVGFNIQHDGGHRAYSRHNWVNKLMAMSLDLLGGSSYVWARKHNSIHHSFSNITGHDDDINIGLLGRLSPHQKRLKIHALQHFYLWVLYGLLPIKWQFYDDFDNVLTRQISGHRLARPTGWDLVIFVGGKVAFFSLAFVIPMALHPWWAVLMVYGVASFVQGLALSVVFQLAHCVEDADFPLPQEDSGRMESAWAVHQLETTVDFGRDSKLLTWCVGGLNFQIEHHLFPQICHVHYPAISQLVEQTCEEFGVRYRSHDTLLVGLRSHYQWLRRMGREA